MNRANFFEKPGAKFAVFLTANIAFFLLIAWAFGAETTSRVSQSSEIVSNQIASTFVGSQACGECHSKQVSEWSSSHHSLAMQEPTDKSVLGKFDGRTFEKDGVTSTFFQKDSAYWIETDGPDGKLATFKVAYTFGVEPLQQYLIALPGGKFQAFGIAWDARPAAAGGQRWFHLYPKQKLKPGNPLHWTGIDQNWNYQCAWCHSTNLQKNYDSATQTFKTTWSEINVGCESCHGPASRHITWTQSAEKESANNKGFDISLDERRHITWSMGSTGKAQRSSKRTSNKEIDICSGCHARRQQHSSKPADIAHFTDAFRPALLSEGLYFSDGQQRDEVYKTASFLQSRMHAAGVTCSDCHNPHSGKLVAEGNAVCAQCHAPERFDTPTHHHHKNETAGAKCTSCHMPTTTYMGVDARHDHSIRIPRPDRSVLLGTPNACTNCHTDEKASWARDSIKRWYPNSKPGFQSFAEVFDLGDRAAPGAVPALVKIATNETNPAIVRASALNRLNQSPSPNVLTAARHSLADTDPIVRTAAIAIIASADTATRSTLLAPMLSDPSRLVRMDAARALADEVAANLNPKDREAFDKAALEYIEAQQFNAERPEAHLNLAQFYRSQGNLDGARKELNAAISLDPTFVEARIVLADLEWRAGNESQADTILRDALAADSNSAPVEHALGLSLVRRKRIDEAITYLRKAVEHAPQNARFGYVLATALHDTGNRSEAVNILKSILVHYPYDRSALYSLTSYEMESQNFASALKNLELLNKLEPENRDIQNLLTHLRQRAN